MILVESQEGLKRVLCGYASRGRRHARVESQEGLKQQAAETERRAVGLEKVESQEGLKLQGRRHREELPADNSLVESQEGLKPLTITSMVDAPVYKYRRISRRVETYGIMQWRPAVGVAGVVESQEGLKQVGEIGYYVYPLGSDVESQEGLKRCQAPWALAAAAAGRISRRVETKRGGLGGRLFCPFGRISRRVET